MRQVLLAMIIFVATLSSAHALSVTGTTESSPYIINNPETLQLFSGELDGAAYFRLTSGSPFLLDVQVLAPYENGYDANAHTVSLLVLTDSRKEVGFVYEDSYFWSTKQVGGDYYFAGPEVSENASAGAYTIKLYSSKNNTKYILSVGTKGEVAGVQLDQVFTMSALQNFLQLLGLIMISGCVVTLYFANVVSRRSKEMNRIVIDFYYRTRYIAWAGIIITFAGWLPALKLFSFLGIAKTLFLLLIVVHWAYFSLRVQPKFAKVRGKALLTPKFQSYISRHMTAQFIKLAIVLLLTAAMI